MYEWYGAATECFVYMKDVTSRPNPDRRVELYQDLARSDWFNRGWTLQELLAPKIVIFCNAHWEVIGHSPRGWNFIRQPLPRRYYGPSLVQEVSHITNIPVRHLDGHRNLRQASIARRMGWASRRTTSRVEDEAYCLLGIFDINMPLIYGEGQKAFMRLQEEIIRRSTDRSILAWNTSSDFPPARPVLATSPREFPAIPVLEPTRLSEHPFTITNKGLEMRANLQVLSDDVPSAAGVHMSQPNNETFEYCYMEVLNTGHNRYGWILLKGIHSNLYQRVNQAEREDRFSGKETHLLTDQLIYLATANELVDIRY